VAQHKLEFKSRNWFVRGYTTQENSGDSYQATALGRLLNESWKPTLTFAPNGAPNPQATDWLVQYIGNYLGYKYNASLATGVVGNEYAAHNYGRGQADIGRLMPGTAAYNDAVNQIKGRPIPKGAKFQDRSDLWAGEAQLNVSDQAGFSNMVEMIAGIQFKQNVLNSQGTIFADTAGKLKTEEYGGYIQLRKKLLNDRLTLTAAGRFDKHSNFEGRFTPRIAAVFQVAPNNNIRVSYQTAYRFPTNQDQYINLYTGSVYLIGALPEFQDYYKTMTTNPIYTAESIGAARSALNPALLVKATYNEVKPESVASYEIGYKGVVAKKLFVDAYYYFSKYNDFLGRIAVGQSGNVSYGNGASVGTASPVDLLNPLITRNLSYIQNTDQEVKAVGWGISLEYQLPRNFTIYGNVFSDELKDVPAGVVTSFNAPKYRYNIGLRNENVYRNIGMNFVWKWQDENFYEGTFATGTLPAFGTLDGQISYRLPKTKSLFRIGATNILNQYNRTGYGNPYIGGLYYVSYGYNF
jgi:outer membrane receptor protein involved in Fe transport